MSPRKIEYSNLLKARLDGFDVLWQPVAGMLQLSIAKDVPTLVASQRLPAVTAMWAILNRIPGEMAGVTHLEFVIGHDPAGYPLSDADTLEWRRWTGWLSRFYGWSIEFAGDINRKPVISVRDADNFCDEFTRIVQRDLQAFITPRLRAWAARLPSSVSAAP